MIDGFAERYHQTYLLRFAVVSRPKSRSPRGQKHRNFCL